MNSRRHGIAERRALALRRVGDPVLVTIGTNVDLELDA